MPCTGLGSLCSPGLLHTALASSYHLLLQLVYEAPGHQVSRLSRLEHTFHLSLKHCSVRDFVPRLPHSGPGTLNVLGMCLVTSSSLQPQGLQPARLLCPWDSPGQNTGVGCHPPGELCNPGTEPRSPALQADSSLSEPPGKPKNTGVGSLSLLQGIFPTQELNRGLLH